MSASERNSMPTAAAILVIGLWLYCAALALRLAGAWHGAAHTAVITSWWVLPTQLISFVLVGMRLRRGDLHGPRLVAWSLLLVSIATDTVATYGFGSLTAAGAATYAAWTDVPYLIDYLLMTAISAMLFVACGGSFRRRRVWLDGATLMVGLFAVVLPFILDPLASGGRTALEVAVAIGYALGILASATMAGLLTIQVADWRDEKPTLLIVAAFAIALAADVWVLAGAVRGESLQDGLGNLVYSVYGALIVTAAVLRPPPASTAAAHEDSEGRLYGFLPMLTLLLAVVLVLGTQARHSGRNVAFTAILVLVGAALLVVRQRAVRDQLRQLHRELAVRQADARLTELVRSSSDAIAVVSAAGVVSYLSPAAATVLGAEPASRVGTRAAALLGADNEALLDAFLRELRRQRTPRAELEVELRGPGGRRRAVQVVGSDQSHKPLIDGTVLTLRDVSAQRDLEREVLEVATRERQRLAVAIHEDLGQQLTGIALLLRGASGRAHDGDALRAALQPVIGHLNVAIAGVQRLARGLSPLQVVRGSLGSALEQLAAETRARTRLEVTLLSTVPGNPLSDVAADHLYRIAQEAVAAAVRRRNCERIEITLTGTPERLTLVVGDDGEGPESADGADELGLRMIGYRARLLGGGLQLEHPPSGRGRIEVTVPCRGGAAPTGAP